MNKELQEDFDWSKVSEDILKTQEVLHAIQGYYGGYPLSGDWEEWERVSQKNSAEPGKGAFVLGLCAITFVLGWMFLYLSLIWNK